MVVTTHRLLQGLRVLPWLLVGLPVALLGYEITTTPFVGVSLLGIVTAFLLYRTTAHNETYIRMLLLACYSLGIGVIAQFDLHGLYVLQHLSWVVVIVLALLTLAVSSVPVVTDPEASSQWRWWGSVIGVGGIAFVIRAHGLQTAPVIGGDEANASLYGLEVLKRHRAQSLSIWLVRISSIVVHITGTFARTFR